MEQNFIEPIRITNNVFTDERGKFIPFPMSGNDFTKMFTFDTYQLNTVMTDKPYTFRGMHWQDPPFVQAKFIRCIFGKIIDFAIDIREGSPNYGKSYGFVLNNPEEWVFIPKGFAHGYLTLPHNLGNTYPTMVEYLVNNHYDKNSERGVCLPVEIIDIINREIPIGTNLIINDRDLNWPTINEIKSNFKYYEPDEQ